jgi:hypothetical protein
LLTLGVHGIIPLRVRKDVIYIFENKGT